MKAAHQLKNQTLIKHLQDSFVQFIDKVNLSHNQVRDTDLLNCHHNHLIGIDQITTHFSESTDVAELFLLACCQPLTGDNALTNSDLTEILKGFKSGHHDLFNMFVFSFLEKFYVHYCKQVFHLLLQSHHI